jgi:hypothetical protein
LAAILVGVLGLIGVMQTSLGTVVLRGFGITGGSGYTSLAFANPLRLAAAPTSARPVPLDFVVANHTANRQRYSWTATRTSGARTSLLAHGRLTIAGGADGLVRLQAPAPCGAGNRTVRYAVRLRAPSLSITHLATCP